MKLPNHNRPIELVNWMDKRLNEISDTDLFKKYFENVQIFKDEKDCYLSNNDEGIDIVMSEDFTINSIHLFSEKYMGFKAFKGGLPFNVEFCFTRSDIVEKLGKPQKSGGGHQALYVGRIAFWDKYYFEKYTLHFRYSDNDSTIDMVTLSSVTLEDYFNSEFQ